MIQHSGPISDKLRKLFTRDQILSKPLRNEDSLPMPKSGVQGVELGGKAGRKAKKRK